MESARASDIGEFPIGSSRMDFQLMDLLRLSLSSKGGEISFSVGIASRDRRSCAALVRHWRFSSALHNRPWNILTMSHCVVKEIIRRVSGVSAFYRDSFLALTIAGGRADFYSPREYVLRGN